MQKKSINPIILAIIIIIALVGLAAGAIWIFGSRALDIPGAKNTLIDSPSGSEKTLRLAAMGDMLAHDSITTAAKKDNTYDFAPYFKQITSLYSDADVVFCNPETLVSGEPFVISGYPSFNAPTEFARDLVSSARCNLITTATNHIGDKGQDALNATLDVWDQQSTLAVTGANRSAAEQRIVKYFEKNDIKVAFLAFADYSNNRSVASSSLNSYHDETLVRTLMTEARRNADVVIVSMHWGAENSTDINPDQEAAASKLANLGADIVIGTGPHVLQKVDYVAGNADHPTLVWYSIGNMLSAQLQVNELTGGVAGMTIVKGDNGKISLRDLSFRSTYMSYDWPPADRTLQKLTTRSNFLLEPLENAGGKPDKMFGPSFNITERSNFVKQTLGDTTRLKITP